MPLLSARPLCDLRHQAGRGFRGQEERRGGRRALENEALKTTTLWGSPTSTLVTQERRGTGTRPWFSLACSDMFGEEPGVVTSQKWAMLMY